MRAIGDKSDSEEDEYYIHCKSPFAWRKLEPEQSDFNISTKDDSGKGYFEVVRGKVEKREGTVFFVPEKTASKPELMSSEIFKLRRNDVKNITIGTENMIGEVLAY